MFETISKGFRAARDRLKGFREITPENIDEALREIRVSLLEGDVEFNVVKDFLAHVKQKALGEVVQTSVKHKGSKVAVSPGDHFVKICQDELERLMGEPDSELRWASVGITKIMMVGLQGSGKTTTTAKLAAYLEKAGKRPMLVAADIYRPAAVEQLQVLGERLGMPVFHQPGKQPPELCGEAVAAARDLHRDVLIFDTAGRLSVDEVLMKELEEIRRVTQPENIFLVLDAMTGQDAVKTASAFDQRLDLAGVILTKLDGDARGGAALSVRAVTGKPIKFLGMGESLDRLEEFRPEGLASRILGMGDIVGLMQDFEAVVDEKQAEEDAEKLLSGDFDFTQFLEQIRTIQKMGSLRDLMEKMPFFQDGLPEGANVDDRELVKIEAIIGSMTAQERKRPELFNESRVERVARGSGRTPEEVQDLLSRFNAMRDMMRKIGKTPGLLGRIPGLKQLSQMRQLRGMQTDDVMSALGGMGIDPGTSGKSTSRHFDKAKARKKAKLARAARKKARKGRK